MDSHEAPFQASIEVLRENGRGNRIFELPRSWCVIGSHEDCDIRIDSIDVANLHALIQIKNDSLILQGLHKEKTVTIEGSKRVLDADGIAKLKNKDVFSIGGYSFQINFTLPKTPKKRNARKRSSASAKKSSVAQNTSTEQTTKPADAGRRRRSSLVITETEEFIVYSNTNSLRMLSPEQRQRISEEHASAIGNNQMHQLETSETTEISKESTDEKETTTKSKKIGRSLPPLQPTSSLLISKHIEEKSNKPTHVSVDETSPSDMLSTKEDLHRGIKEKIPELAKPDTSSEVSSDQNLIESKDDSQVLTIEKQIEGKSTPVSKNLEPVNASVMITETMLMTPQPVSRKQFNPKTPRSVRERRSLAFIRLSQGLSATPSTREETNKERFHLSAPRQKSTLHTDPIISTEKENVEVGLTATNEEEATKKNKQPSVSNHGNETDHRTPLSPNISILNTPPAKESMKLIRGAQTAVKKTKRSPLRMRRKSVAFANDIEFERGPHYSPYAKLTRKRTNRYPRPSLKGSPVKRSLLAEENTGSKPIPRPSPPNTEVTQEGSSYCPGPAPTSALARFGEFFYPNRAKSPLATTSPEQNSQDDASNVTPEDKTSSPNTPKSTTRRISGTLSYIWRRLSSGGSDDQGKEEAPNVQDANIASCSTNNGEKEDKEPESESPEPNQSTESVMTESEVKHITAKASPPVKRRLITSIFDAATAMRQAIGPGSISSDSVDQNDVSEVENMISEEATQNVENSKESSSDESLSEDLPVSADSLTTEDVEDIRQTSNESFLSRDLGDSSWSTDSSNEADEQEAVTCVDEDADVAIAVPAPEKNQLSSASAEELQNQSHSSASSNASSTSKDPEPFESIDSVEALADSESIKSIHSTEEKDETNLSDEDEYNEVVEWLQKGDESPTTPLHIEEGTSDNTPIQEPEEKNDESNEDGNDDHVNEPQIVDDSINTNEIVATDGNPQDESVDISKYREKTVKDLRQILRDRNLAIPSKLRKEQLIEHIIGLSIGPDGQDIVKPESIDGLDKSTDGPNDMKLEKCTVAELRTILKEKGDCQWGAKAVLLNRLTPQPERRTRRRSVTSEKNVCKACAIGDTCEGEKTRR